TYTLDTGRSYVSSVKSLPQNLEIEAADTFVSAHPASSAALPDGRSISVRVHFSLYGVPSDNGYQPRRADTRVGYFVTAYKDLSSDSDRDPFVRFIERWDIRKLHPEKPMSLPVQPVVYWLDDAIPLKYRPAITEGILRWNRAFEKIGIEDAIQVRVRPSDADWDISDARFNVIRWFNANEDAPAIGMHRVNPYTGQILSATVVINDGFTRSWKSYYHDYLSTLIAGQPFGTQQTGIGETRYRLLEPGSIVGPPAPNFGGEGPGAMNPGLLTPLQTVPNGSYAACSYSTESIPQFAVAATAASLLGPGLDDTVPRQIVDQYLAEITSHEIGHTLGLRHNFKGSAMLPYASLWDTALTRRVGTSASVMDYLPPLIALPGHKQGDYFTTTLGPYDEWAIEYGYTPLTAGAASGDDGPLGKIAGRSSDSALQYGTDEDAAQVDPTVARFDYGRQPLDWSEHNIALAHLMFSRIPKRLPLRGRTYDDVYSAYITTLGMYISAFNTPLRTIGGSYIHRDHAGQNGGRLPVEMAPAPVQLHALHILLTGLFDDRALQIPPSLLDRALPDRWMHWDSSPFGAGYGPTSLRAVILSARRAALETLYSPALLGRLEDQNLFAKGREERMDVGRVIDDTTHSLWAELTGAGPIEISPLRRDTQQIQLSGLINLGVSSDSGAPEDARSMARYELNWLDGSIHKALTGRDLPLLVRAHLQNSLSRIHRALSAQMSVGG
nr:zinc-dependent metalloprotease [Armatimonadota bacterium]